MRAYYCWEDKMLIGFTGAAQAGKTTIGNYLVKKYKFTKFAFADPLKAMLINAGLITYEEAYKTKTKNSRMLMQKIGTEIFRNQVDKNYWVKEAEKQLKQYRNEFIDNITIDDVRFPDEADFIVNSRGFLIKVVRTSFEDGMTDASHESERYVCTLPYCFTLEAKSGNIESLYKQMDYFLERNKWL